jgi:hypothetical protein
MTTIAWDGESIAADRRACGNAIMSVGKLFRLPDGSVLGGAGDYAEVVEVVAWVLDGCNPDARPRFADGEGSSLLLARPDGTAYWLTWPYLRQVQINERFAAEGSGSQFALGAMAMGASARRAVQISAKFDPYTGGGVNVIKVRK